MEEIEGVLTEIIYQNEVNSYTVGIFETEDEQITIVGYLPFISKGDTLKLLGKFVEHKDYGEQFKIETFEKLMPQTLGALENYLANGNIKGVGPATASKIIQLFGEETIHILKYEPIKLAQIRGISKEKALEISESFVENWEVWQIVGFLERFGIGAENAKKVYDLLGVNAISEIEANPYILIDISRGVDFKQIDNMAIKLGIVYTEKSTEYNSIIKMWGLRDTEQVEDRLPNTLNYTNIELDRLINGFIQYVSGGIHIVNRGIPIELKGIYDKEKDYILIKETIPQSSKIQALVKGIVQASLSRLTSECKVYQGAFKGWTIDGTEMLNISDSSTKAVIESATFVVLSRLDISTSDCDLNFIGGWKEAREESKDGMEYIDLLLECIRTISHRVLYIIESIFNTQGVNEIELEMQEEKVDTFLATAEANSLRYNLGID